ncbi:hypothetical protein ADL29_18270 [Streptomyces chattanoogensis]|uniref:Uncharacterized protein n=1 Tax=Streptomyces chattanoogensis TaxID=66876 RepID=A0A0N0XUS4_9ACTN|nr:hypothetical protein ADL29_18270 [Streptomyces chattanoogensis]
MQSAVLQAIDTWEQHWHQTQAAALAALKTAFPHLEDQPRYVGSDDIRLEYEEVGLGGGRVCVDDEGLAPIFVPMFQAPATSALSSLSNPGPGRRDGAAPRRRPAIRPANARPSLPGGDHRSNVAHDLGRRWGNIAADRRLAKRAILRRIVTPPPLPDRHVERQRTNDRRP